MGNEIIQDSTICKFHKKLKKDLVVHEGEFEASNIKVEAWEIERGYALCTLSKSEQTFNYYRDLNNFELFDMKDSAEIIKANIDEYVKKDDTLGKSINDVSKALNELKDNLHDANNAACTMRNCLQSSLGFKDDEVPCELKKVTDLAKNLSKGGKKVADAMVTVAGIHTFSNLETLKPHATDLAVKLSTLKALTDSYITAAEVDEKAAQEAFEKALKELNKEEFSSFRMAGDIDAEKNTIKFICNDHCEPISCVELICKSVVNKTSPGTPSGCYSQGDKD